MGVQMQNKLNQMSTLNRNAMMEVKKWKEEVQGENGILQKMLQEAEACYKEINEYGVFWYGEDDSNE